MKWEKVKLGEIIEIKKGAYITKKDSKEGPYPVILGGREPAYYIDTFNHTGKAIVISRSGASAGYVSFWNEPIFVTDGFLIEPKENVNIDFLYYLIKSRQAELQGKQGGAAIPHVNPRTINAIEVKFPSTSIQERIVEILSAYDDLIENNQRQIKLLEEAAQRLYKEWFVDFRFPGHESTPIINGIPQGWKKGVLGDVAFFKRGKTITKNQTHEGVVPVVAGGLEPAYYHNQSNTASPVITVSGSGANAGFTRLYHTEIWASDCSFVDAQSTENIFFTFCTLKYKKGDIDALQKGAAQPHVYAKDVNALEILIPTDELFANFKSFITPYFNKIKGLVQQIDLAIEARDRLLPKLMSGELEVE